MSSEFVVSRVDRLDRLRAHLRGEPVSKKFEGLTRSSRGANLLLGILLHGAARVQAGVEPTDLEARLLGSVAGLLGEEELRDFGRVYVEETAGRAGVFPDSLAARSIDTGYTAQDLAADLPAVGEEVAGQANVNVIDVDVPAPDPRGPQAEAYARAVGAYGYGATVMTSATAENQVDVAAAPVMTKVWLDRLYMYVGSDEFGSEEIYAATAAAADGGTRQWMRSHTVEGVNTGESHPFGPNTVIYHGTAERGVIFNVQCWEEDHGQATQLLATLESISKTAWELADALPEGKFSAGASEILAFASGIANLIKLFVSFFADDLIEQRVFAFDRAALNAIAAKPFHEDDHLFNGGGFLGNGTIYLAIRTRVGKLPRIGLRAHNASGWHSPSQPGGVSHHAPALASFGNHLYSAHAGIDKQVYITRFDGTSWSGHTVVPSPGILSAPALAVHAGRLYLAHRDLDNRVIVTSTANGITWTASVVLRGTTTNGPALATSDGHLYCVVRGAQDLKSYFALMESNNTWRAFEQHNAGGSYFATNMLSHGNGMHMTRTAGNGQVYIKSHNNYAWSVETSVGQTSAGAPALALYASLLHCVIPGTDENLWMNRQTANGWDAFQQIPGTANTVTAAGTATHNGTLYVAYATATPGL
ncbi:hypothetical protein [Streptomyces sp. NPDC002209]|uniref:hypothetical protein n=1 Tax=Streptomyces sp. NPDC002209 TaxID=3364638 RepID=UPI0036C6A983